MLTRTGNNAAMRTRRSKGSGSLRRCSRSTRSCSSRSRGSLPGSLGNYFFGPKFVRAEVLVKDGGVLHDYRIDRGVIRSKADGTLTLLERDGTLVPIPVAATAAITLNGRPVGYAALRRGMVATVIRDGDAPANEVRATRR